MIRFMGLLKLLSMETGSSVVCFVYVFVAFACLAVPPLQGRQEGSNSESFRLQGEFHKGGRGVQVAAIGEDAFRVVFHNGGLPGDGWDRSPVQVIEMDIDDLREFLTDAQRVQRTSNTIGAPPPKGAIPLFDGTQSSIDTHWGPGARLVDGNNLLAGCTTRQTFRDYRLHLEFKTPFLPKADGQGRGNSGVYHQARYETQVLDSFGFENEGNTCGAIYGIKPADFNACLPPGAWQTYDIDFVAARWDASGKKLADAQLTVWLNGQCIHRDQSVPGPTTAAPNDESPQPGPLYLQDHGNAVSYRNIWLLPMDANRNSQRPRIPGYERLAASSSRADDVRMGGNILISELGCISCHGAGKFEDSFDHKQAPILDRVGSRLRRGYVASMLEDVHRAKIGTTMPDVLHGLDSDTKTETIAAIAAFLESTGKARKQNRTDSQSEQRGGDLYARIGCAICHGFPEGRSVTSTSVPLPVLSNKYTLDGLAAFLKQPHLSRPSNRMPGMHLDDHEVRDIASYLLPNSDRSNDRPDTRYRVYEGSWEKLPNFDAIEPYSEGTCQGLDLSVASKTNNFGVCFDTYLFVDQSETYRFFLGSDDGSKLTIDGKQVVDADGVHPHQVATGEMMLEAGVHPLRVEYFQGGGEWTIGLEWESDTLVRQSLEGWFQLSPDVPDAAPSEPPIQPQLVEKGRVLFQSIGCASCHSMRGLDGGVIAVHQPGSRVPPTLDRLDLEAGCLSEAPGPRLPDYRLSPFQKEAIRAALSSAKPSTDIAQQRSMQLLTQLNCIACHQRNAWGGPEADRREFFLSTIPEMGDEGRLPPTLTGVGDKLNDKYLARVLADGARERKYMLVRMPQFGSSTEGLADHWRLLDRPDQDSLPRLANEPEIRAIAAGRQLVGTKGLACAQCHTFGNERALGIQAINLLTMPDRLRPEWFYRYMLEPTRYRPGTRMPASFPEGVSVLKTIHDGSAENQIAAIWLYLSQGSSAAVPEGLQRNQIVLEPTDRPVVYRNFIEGLSNRGIAVGYPGGTNIAWDGETMALALAWQGQFLDASIHWRDRGAGRARPLGDLVLGFERVSPIAILESAGAPWPTAEQIAVQSRFLGYRLDPNGSPTFRYVTSELEVNDKPQWFQSSDGSPGLKRSLTLRLDPKATGAALEGGIVCVRLAEGQKIAIMPGETYEVDGKMRLQLITLPPGTLEVRHIQNGNQELLLRLASDLTVSSTIEYLVSW